MKDIYVEFRGKYKVDGESRDTEHKGWLEVNSWSHKSVNLSLRLQVA